MSTIKKEDHFSDDEVFFGKLTLKEIKKHIIWNNHLDTKYTCAASNDDCENDIKIIETHSAPNLVQNEKDILTTGIKPTFSLSPDQDAYAELEVKPVDDSFLKVEQMVEDLCVTSTEPVKKEELNNTLDIIDYILKNGPSKHTSVESKDEKAENNVKRELPKVTITDDEHSEKQIKHSDELAGSSAYNTPPKMRLKVEKFVTPSTDLKQRTPIFKTPGNPLSIKKPSTLKKTPIRSNTYQHIASPVASYIKNCPVTPLVKEVRPTKPLPGTSSIPKIVKTPALNRPGNKENVNLPTVAYKSAKKTQVITVPDEEKMPRTQLMKKITSSLPKPLIMKHNHRELNMAKRVFGSRQEDSIGDLSLRQADVSVCTQKSAYNRPKKPL